MLVEFQGFNSHSTCVLESEIGKFEVIDAKIVSKYDQEIPQSQTADKPMAPQGRATQQHRDTRKKTKQATSFLFPKRG